MKEVMHVQIACTKKLLDELKIKPTEVRETPELYSWRANLVKMNRRKTVVLMCDQNQYIVVLYGLRAKDFKDFDRRIIAAIRNTLLKQGMNSKVVEEYISRCGAIQYVKNSDRSRTARLNQACQHAYFAGRHIEEEAAYCDYLGVYASHACIGDVNGGDYFHPDEKILEDFAEFGIEPVLEFPALELTVTLDLDGRNTYRKLIVPANITFLQLHKVLQTAFDWQNYHLFSFDIYDGDSIREEPIASLVYHEEDLEFLEGARIMRGVSINEYLPAHKYLLYTYDYGDNWQHYIEITGVLEAYSGPCPVCMAGEGNSPPEDVGGAPGFENFLEILSDPEHDEYEDTLAWSKGQKYRDFDMDAINRALRSVLRW